MNQIDEQKGLIEYLEAALTAARKHLASDPEKIAELSANWRRRERSLSVYLQSPAQSIPTAPNLLNREISRHAAAARF